MKKKIAILGNVDNIGVRHLVFLRYFGYEADLYLSDESGLRDGLSYYNYEKNKGGIFQGKFDRLNIIRWLLFPNKQKNKIKKEYNLIFINGISALLASLSLDQKKILVPTGGEVGILCDPRINFLRSSEVDNKFKCYVARFFAIKALKKIDYMIDFFTKNHEVYKLHKLFHRVIPIGFGELSDSINGQHDAKLLSQINNSCKEHKRVFLWFTRLNYKDKKSPNYKGCELFLQALVKFKKSLSSKEIKVFIGYHGFDKESFVELSKKYGVYNYINWVGHLDQRELFSYLLIDNAVLFTDFSITNSAISGIGRDGYISGTPMINSTRNEDMKDQYGASGPRLFASSLDEIINRMHEITEMDNESFSKLKIQTKNYGKNYIDFKNYIKRLRGFGVI